MTNAAQDQSRSLLRRPAVVRLVLVALLAEIGYAVLNISTMQVYLRDDRQFGASVIGFVFVAFLLSEAIFKGPMGHRADRYGAKLLMTVGPGLSVITAGLSLLVPHTGGKPLEVLAFIVLRAFDGLGAAMLWPAAFAYMGELVGDDERQQAMSFLNLCYMLGIALALPIGGLVDDLSHNHWAGLVLAMAMFLAVSLTVYFFIPDKKTAHVDDEHSTGLEDLRRSIKTIPTYLILSIVTFAGIGFPMAIIKLFASDEFKMSETQFGGLVFPAAIVMAALSVPMSKFGDRIGRAKSVHLGMGLCSVGLIVIASGAFTTLTRTPLAMALGAMPVGIGFLLAIPAWMASVSDIDAQRRGANLGAVMTAQGVGAIIGAPIGGAMYEKLGPLSVRLGEGYSLAHYMPFVGCAACVTFGWLLSLKILHIPDRPRPTPS